MRRILFRGIDTCIGNWHYGSLVVWPSGGCEILSPQPGKPDEAGRWRVAPETVGQYTGLTDKGGKKIFEGDIVSLNGKSACKIAFAGGAFNACTAYGEHIPLDDGFYLSLMEVVGNFFDNPELMETRS